MPSFCTNACTKPSDVCHLSYPQLLSCAYSYKYLEVLWLPKRTHVLMLSPTGCTEGCVYFPQSCRNTHLPHFLDCLLNTTLIPCLLVCFLSILHERVCDYSGVQSSVTGILRMGDMNIHITWLTHVRTGPKKKIASLPCTVLVSQSRDTVKPPNKKDTLGTDHLSVVEILNLLECHRKTGT